MKQLHPKAVRSFFYQYLAYFLAIAVTIVLFGFMILRRIAAPRELWIGGIVVLIGGILCCRLWANLVYRNWRYEFTDEGVEVKRGVIRKDHSTIPYTRIQNIDVKQGLVDRILGLGNLVVQTAGSSSGRSNFSMLRVLMTVFIHYSGSSSQKEAEGIIPGIDIKKAKELQETLTRGL